MNANENNLDFQKKFLELIECPIGLEAIKDPVMLVPTGIIYDRKSIESWLERKKTCPNTGTKLTYYELMPVYILKDIIEIFLKTLPDYIKKNLVKQENLSKRIQELESFNNDKGEMINEISDKFLNMMETQNKDLVEKLSYYEDNNQNLKKSL